MNQETREQTKIDVNKIPTPAVLNQQSSTKHGDRMEMEEEGEGGGTMTMQKGYTYKRQSRKIKIQKVELIVRYVVWFIFGIPPRSTKEHAQDNRLPQSTAVNDENMTMSIVRVVINTTFHFGNDTKE